MNPEEFRAAGHQLIDWIADFRAGIREAPVMSQVEPGQVRERLPDVPPEAPESFEQIMADLNDLILPGISHFQHPNFYGYFPANAMLSSVLGDMMSSGLGALGLSWQSAPALTEVEEIVTDWLRQMVGLSDSWEGVIQDTASTSTLLSLICAREKSTNYSLAGDGLQAEPKPLIVYVSEYCHSSVDKAALLAGFGRENVRLIPTDNNFALNVAALEQAILEDLATGKQPCAVVATTGTTTSPAIDPVGPIAEVAQRHTLWLHVDAALAGSAMILPECRHLWKGVEQADSVVLNPHKWLGAAFDCTVYYVQDAEHLIRVMGTNPSYLQSAADEVVKNYRDWGIPLGRRFRALKLWTLIREQGVTKLQERLRRDIANAKWLEEEILGRAGWHVLAPVPLQTVCIRYEPPGLEGDALEQFTQDWVAAVNRSGKAYLTPATLRGSWMARVSIGAYPTERADVAETWQLIYRTAERMV